MPLKKYEERLKETYALDVLCRIAGYISGYEATSNEYTLNDRIKRLANGILLDKKRIDEFMQTDSGSIFSNLFLRELGNEGVEIFYFQNKNVWSQKEQNVREGLVYFCLPNAARLEHEDSYTRSVTHMEELEKDIHPDIKNDIRGYNEAWLNLDKMFPDKWGHMALEILLRQANQD